MEIVLAHKNMDFDCLAAQLAVTKLYPAARLVPAHPLGSHIKSFLALYRDLLPVVELNYVDWHKLTHIYVVDCHSLDRLDERAQRLLKEPNRKVGLTVFDHHGETADGLYIGARADSVHRQVGSATTILVDEICRREIKLSPFEATVLAAGIYEDTGCLTYGSTTADDAKAVGFLIEQGADTAKVAEFIRPKLTDDQAGLFEKLLYSAESKDLGGSRVTVCAGSFPCYIDGLAELTSSLLEATASEVLVSVALMKNRIYIVARSDAESIDLRQLVRDFGGGGHSGAASAVLKADNIAEAQRLVWQKLHSLVRPEPKAREIMISPVRTVRQDISMDEAGRLMLRHGLDGLVVMNDDRVVGIISKRDVDKAVHHNLSHSPVQGFMGHPVVSVDLDCGISQIQALMTKEDIGRLPVLDESGNLLGLVTRREMVRALHGAGLDEPAQTMRLEKVEKQIDKSLTELPEDLQSLYKEVGERAEALGMKAFVVGGCVRDLLLNRENFDLDFVIEGNAIELAEYLAKSDPGRFVLEAKHERFCTAHLFLKAPVEREIDLATARTEFYEFPAALPTVEPSKLGQDLLRRDFTINALAIALNPDHFGCVVDYFYGLRDLEEKVVRILHPFSFIEDPTRILRAVRFAARLNFAVETKTVEYAKKATALGIFDNLGGVRIKEELRLILESPERLESLDLLQELGGGLRFLELSLVYDRHLRFYLRRAERLLVRFPMRKSWIVYLGVLLSGLTDQNLGDCLERLLLADEEKRWILEARQLINRYSSVDSPQRPSKYYEWFHGRSPHSLAIAACLARPGSFIRRGIRLFLDELQDVKPELNGRDLIAMGVPEGPKVGSLLERIKIQRLDGILLSKEDERRLVEAELSGNK